MQLFCLELVERTDLYLNKRRNSGELERRIREVMSSILQELLVKFKTVESRLEKLVTSDGAHIEYKSILNGALMSFE